MILKSQVDLTFIGEDHSVFDTDLRNSYKLFIKYCFYYQVNYPDTEVCITDPDRSRENDQINLIFSTLGHTLSY